MTAGLYGILAALGWGSADFISRFTSRTVGYQQALFGMLSIGAPVLSLFIALADIPMIFVVSGWWLLALTGIGTMVATLLLYQGLARGPVTIVAPIVGSFPIFNVILALFYGSRPNAIQWLAMATVFIGVWLVTLASSKFEAHPDYNREHLQKTIFIAFSSSLSFGTTIAAAQAASLIYGELQTVCIARWISLLSLAFIFVYKKTIPVVTLSCFPLIASQSLMDTGAYAALAWSTQVENAEIAVVVSSGFSIVTVLLGRLFLKEKMSGMQWTGVLSIIVGVAILSGFG